MKGGGRGLKSAFCGFLNQTGFICFKGDSLFDKNMWNSSSSKGGLRMWIGSCGCQWEIWHAVYVQIMCSLNNHSVRKKCVTKTKKTSISRPQILFLAWWQISGQHLL